MTEKPRLTRLDWIQAAFRALHAGGPKAIRAESIARDLKVSKGSFYWHFKNVADLGNAMIDHWRSQATQIIIEQIEQTTPHSPEKLRALFTLIAGSLATPYGGIGVESAIRDWARYDTSVQNALYQVDKQRMGYVQGLLINAGQPKSEAARHTRLLYAALLGFQHLSYLKPEAPMDDLPALLDMILDK